MKFQLENDFNKHVKSSELLRVYMLYGSQDYLIGLYEKQLLQKVLGEKFNDFNLHRFESGSLNLQEFYDAVESVPLMGSGRCVTVEPDLDKLDTGQIEEFCNVLKDPPMTTTIIVTVKRSPSKREKLNALIKVCDKVGGVIELGSRSNTDTLKFLRNRAQKNGCILSSDCASYLVRRCTDDLQLLLTETDKLCAYVGEGTITHEDIDEISSAVLQARVFDLSKAILRKNFTKAIETLDQLLYLREAPSKILAVLSGAFVDLYRGFAARQLGITASQAAIELGYAKNREFAIKNAMSDSSELSAKQIGYMLDVLVKADYWIKSSSTDERVILEQSLARLFLIMEKS